MPSIEELLNEAESHMAAQPVNDVLEINPETREISIPDSEIILGVETDQKAERKYFHCPKIVGNNIDLSALELYVVFQNASNKEEGKDRYHVTDVKTTSDGYITFSWELSAKVTAYKGDVQFVVCAIKTDSSGVKQNVWNTTIAIGKCLIGLSSDMSESEEQSASDLYTQLISELNSTASAKLAEVTTQIQTVGNNQVSNVNNAGTTQVNNVQNKGTEVLASIPDTYTELDASVKQLNEQIRGKAPVITESITIQSGSPTTVTDSAEMPLQGLNVYGKSKQVTTTGANLFDANDVSKGYISDDTGSNIVVANSYCSNFIAVSAKTKYYLYSGQDGGRWGAFYDSSKTFILGIGPDKYNTVFETPENAAYIRFTVDYNNNNPDFANNVIFAKSTVALPFEPYTGGKPSPSPEYPQEIVSVGQKLSTGKNLINADEYYSQFKQSDGTYKGENTVINKIAIPLAHFVGKKIVISANIDFPSTIDTMQIRAAIGENNYYGDIVYPNTNKRSVLTVTVQTQNDNFWFTYGSGSGQVIISDIQVELSSTATSYEPYTGGKPAPYKTDCGIEITGKNYVNKSKFEATYEHKDGYYYGEIYLQYTNSKLYYDISDFKNGHGYKFSATVKTTNKRVHGLVFEYTDGTFTRSGGEILENTEKTISVVSDKTKIIKACYINYGEGTKVYIKDDISIIDVDEQSIATIPISNGLPGIPVTTGGNYTDENGQQYICDEIDFSRGKYVQRVWQAEFDGSKDENWTFEYKTKTFYADNILPVSMNYRIGFSNKYIANRGKFDVIGIQFGRNNKHVCVVNDSIFDELLSDYGLSNWKAHLAEHPLKVMTYIDTPIETDLTEAQIQAYKSLTTFKPTSIISNDANAWMEVEYACDTKTWVTNKINTLIKEATTS